MTLLDVSVPFSLGVVSSLHCAQMCGPIVLAYSLKLEHPALSHLAYNAGRIATYALLGAIAGFVGTLGHLAGIERWTILVCGVGMLIAGVLLFPRKGLIQIQAPSLFSRLTGALLRSNKLLLGLLMGLLPCGLVYAALIQAMSTGSALTGAVSMLAFGAGTAGALLGIGFCSGAILAKLGRHSAALTATSVLLAGAFLVWRGILASTMPMRCH